MGEGGVSVGFVVGVTVMLVTGVGTREWEGMEWGLTSRQKRHADALLMRDALQRADEIGALEVLGLVRPLVAELVEHVDVAEGTQDAAHEAGLADCFLDGVEAGADDALGAHYAGDGAGDFAEHVVGPRHGLLACRDGVCELFGRL